MRGSTYFSFGICDSNAESSVCWTLLALILPLYLYKMNVFFNNGNIQVVSDVLWSQDLFVLSFLVKAKIGRKRPSLSGLAGETVPYCSINISKWDTSSLTCSSYWWASLFLCSRYTTYLTGRVSKSVSDGSWRTRLPTCGGHWASRSPSHFQLWARPWGSIQRE